MATTSAALDQRLTAALSRADDLAEKASAAKEDARVAATEAAELQAEVDREAWVAAQVALGHPADTIDVDRGIVTTLPIGPTYA